MILLKKIPKIDKFIAKDEFRDFSTQLITKITKTIFAKLREDILNNLITEFNEQELIENIKNEYEKITSSSLKSVINGSGIIVHTNLGRSLISENSIDSIKQIVTKYNNLEYDLEKGKRGERYSHVSSILKELIGCEDAIVVNNNASAVFLILNTFSKNKEVIVSRGELVEIGGSFRVPEVMSQSGAKLKEVGATNKTHLKDYTEAISKKTNMIMKVHKSNYSIEGFSSEVEFSQIVKIAKENNVIDYYDMGSGHIIDLPYGLDRFEPSILKIMESNPSLMSFSGDKLLGSVQAGIIVGKKELIDKLKKNQLLRMLRVDKITLALLEQTLKDTLTQNYQNIPTLKMLLTSENKLKQNAMFVKNNIKNIYEAEIINTQTLIGGGTTPNRKIPSVALIFSHKKIKINRLEKLFRTENIIVRIENEMVVLDFRAISENELQVLSNKIIKIFKSINE